jgi:hypothetical protein
MSREELAQVFKECGMPNTTTAFSMVLIDALGSRVKELMDEKFDGRGGMNFNIIPGIRRGIIVGVLLGDAINKGTSEEQFLEDLERHLGGRKSGQ